MAPRVLISDKLSTAAVEIFRARGIDTDYAPELGTDRDALLRVLDDYDGIAIRSATRLSESVLRDVSRLKVIGRAGIGVDNIDVGVASAKGIIVMNTPFGNSVTTAEHAISLMLALARQIPEADRTTQAGKWEKNRFVGVEITGKTLGVVGCGNIGSIVIDRAHGLKMKVLGFDPFLSAERARELGIEKVELDELLARSDFITLHTPLTDKTRNIIGAGALAKTRPGVRIVNCARGGLVDEAALRAALESGHVAGAALDVFSQEPATDNVLFGAPNLICTPHLGAATREAQEKVALQIAEQMSDYLLTGAVINALNMPAISAEEAPRLAPYVKLADALGSFAGQLTESGIGAIRLEYEGDVAEMNVKALTSAALAGLMRPLLQDVNMVSAPVMAKERGIRIEEICRTRQSAYESYIRLTVSTDRQERSVAGTVFSDGKPRLIQIKGINMEAELAANMLYVANEDKPGFIGAIGTLLGEAGINIATFNLGRTGRGGHAICLVEVDGPVPEKVLGAVRTLPMVTQAKPLSF